MPFQQPLTLVALLLILGCGAVTDLELLAAFYNSTNGPQWSSNCRWPQPPTCSSFGVRCSTNNDVTQILLSNCGIRGTLPSQWSDMSALQTVNLELNQLNGTLPPQWSRMSALRTMTFYSNQLTGTLPAQWSNMSALRSMTLSTNQLNGTLPAEWSSMSALQTLSLYSNPLTGTLPPQWSNMSALQTLSLFLNNLTGTLPSQWSNMTTLRTLSLYSNQLTGTLPPQWSNMSALQTMHLFSTPLSGTLPPQWSSMSALRILFLYSNPLTGTLPPEWSNMSALRNMNLHSNQLTGTLPPQWAKMSALQTMYLHSNQLNGTLPPEWSKMPALRTMHLYSNQLTGSLPSQWSSMSGLHDVNVASNQLTGTLPAQWSNMSVLQTMCLLSNKLTGTLPPQWSNMSGLQDVNLGSNQLTGTLPPQWSSMSALRVLFLYSNQLNGTLPPQWSNMSALQTLSISSNHLRGLVPPQWQSLPAGSYSVTSLDLQDNCLTLPPEAWYTAASYSSSVVVIPSKPAAFCLSSTQSYSQPPTRSSTHTYSVTPAVSSTSNLSSSKASMSFSVSSVVSNSLGSVTPTETLTATPSVRCDLQWCGVAGHLNANRTFSSLPRVALLPASADALLLRAAAVPYAAALDATVFSLRIVCGDYPLPLRVRDAVLLDSGVSLNLQLLDGTDEVLLSIPNLTLGRPSWLPAGALPFRSSNTIRIGLTISCGGDVAIEVTVPVSPELLPALARSTAVASDAAQWVSAVGGTGSAGSIGRAAAAQRLQLCSSAGSAYGGLLGLSIDGNGDQEQSFARGAVVSNAAVLAAAAAALLGVALLFDHATGADCRSSLLRVALPSSLLPVWAATLPTSAAALPLLVDDVGLFVLGTAALLLPMLLLLALWLSARCGGLIVVEPAIVSHERIKCSGTALSVAVTLLRRSLARRWRWRDGSHTVVAPSTLLRAAWVVLLDHRVLWYPALDAGVLTATCVLAVVSGMGDVQLCRSAGWAMLALCAVQLCVCLAVRPMTSLAANAHCVSCLVLTCAALLVQCVGLGSGELLPPAAATAAVVLQLAVVGLSLVKLLDDVWNAVVSGLRLLTDVGLHASTCAALTSNPCFEPGVASEGEGAAEFHDFDVELLIWQDANKKEDEEFATKVSPLEVEPYPTTGEVGSVPSPRLMLYEELARLSGGHEDSCTSILFATR